MISLVKGASRKRTTIGVYIQKIKEEKFFLLKWLAAPGIDNMQPNAVGKTSLHLLV